MSADWQRVVSIDSGVAMVVTDLHGDWDAYRRCRDRFLSLQAQGAADHLIVTGDVIHLTGPRDQDYSLKMVLDLMSLQQELGPHLVYLLGNHELPHIYNITLQKGDTLFTPRFQTNLGEHRQEVISYFASLPFFVRTKAGVALGHSGVSSVFDFPQVLQKLFDYSHERLLQTARELAPPETRAAMRQEISDSTGKSYDAQVRDYFAVDGPDDPRYDDYLFGSIAFFLNEFDWLWQTLITRNEYLFEPGRLLHLVIKLLEGLSEGYSAQNVLVTGHMDCQGGHTVVNPRYLRLCSAKNAHPRESGRYLLFDTAAQVQTAVDLLSGLGSVFAAV